jgi:hypothetical protein
VRSPTKLVPSPAKKALAGHAATLRPQRPREIFPGGLDRFNQFLIRDDGLPLHFSRKRITAATLVTQLDNQLTPLFSSKGAFAQFDASPSGLIDTLRNS